MRKTIYYVPALVLAALCLGFLVSDPGVWQSHTAIAAEETAPAAVEDAPRKVSFAKDLRILEVKDMIELQTTMKTITESLGVTCKFCHNLADFSQTVPELHKDEAREMMKLTNQMNKDFFKEPDNQVTCFTCHRGHEHPANTKETWEKQMSEKQGQ